MSRRVEAIHPKDHGAHVGQEVADFKPRIAHKNPGVARLTVSVKALKTRHATTD
jgi:hypothetical protein